MFSTGRMAEPFFIKTGRKEVLSFVPRRLLAISIEKQIPSLVNPNGKAVVSLNGYKKRGFNHIMHSVSKSKWRGRMYHEWRKG